MEKLEKYPSITKEIYFKCRLKNRKYIRLFFYFLSNNELLEVFFNNFDANFANSVTSGHCKNIFDLFNNDPSNFLWDAWAWDEREIWGTLHKMWKEIIMVN